MFVPFDRSIGTHPVATGTKKELPLRGELICASGAVDPNISSFGS